MNEHNRKFLGWVLLGFTGMVPFLLQYLYVRHCPDWLAQADVGNGETATNPFYTLTGAAVIIGLGLLAGALLLGRDE